MAQTEDTDTKEQCASKTAHSTKRSFFGRLLRRLFFVFILFPILLLGGVSAWITYLPPNLDRFTPQLNHFLSEQTGFQVKLDGVSARGGLSLAVEGSGVSISDLKTPKPLLTAKTLLLRFSPVNWAKGWNSVGLVVEGADVQLRRDSNGEIFIGNLSLGGKQGQDSQVNKTTKRVPFSSITFRESRIVWLDKQVKNNKKPVKIKLSTVNASLLFQLSGAFRLTVDGKIPAKGWTTQLAFEGEKDRHGRWSGEVKVEELHTATFRPYITNIEPLKGFSGPINLESSLSWDDSTRQFTSYWRLKAGWGVIKWPKMFRWPLPVTGLIANGSLDMEKGISRFEVEQFDLDNLHGKANGRLLLTGLGGTNPKIDLEADAGGIPVNKAKFYYPFGIMHAPVVNWLDDSLKNGFINHANVKIKGPFADIPFDKPKKVSKKNWAKLKKDTQFLIKGEVSGLSLRFYPGVIPLTNISTKVTFDRKAFFGKVEKASFGNSKMIKGDVTIANLVDKSLVDIEFQSRNADLTTLWKEIMANPTLHWDRAIGLVGSSLSGYGDINMKIEVPLWKSSGTSFSGRMDFSEAKVNLPYTDQPFTNVKGWLILNPEKIGISVLESAFADFPVHGQINLIDYSDAKKRYFDARLNSSITEDRLGKWFSPLLGSDGEFLGTAPFWLDIKRSAKDLSFTVKAKLIADSLDIYGTMGWQKPEGEKGAISGSGILNMNGLLLLSTINTELGNLSFKGDGRWDLPRNQGELHFTSFNIGETKGRLGIAQTNPLASGLGDWLVRADLDILDISSLWKTKIRPEIEHIKPIVDREWPRVNLKLKAQRLLLDDRSEANFIIADMDIEKRFFKLHTLQGTWGDGDVVMKGELLWPFQFGSGFYTGWFNIESDDVGYLLESLDIQDNFMFGGSGNLNITLDGFIPPGGEFKDHLTGVGQIKLRNGSFARLEFFSTILGLFSLKDLPNLVVGDRPDLDSKGFSYNSFKGELVFEDSILRTNSLEMEGPSMKIVLSGWVDLPDDRIKLRVGIRPLQTLDSIISKVPLLGTLLAGSRGAVLETQFSVEGKLSKPKVRIRPLSSLIPGIFHDILNAPTKSDPDDGEDKNPDEVTDDN
jgi:uncharacterized protein YhdP